VNTRRAERSSRTQTRRFAFAIPDRLGQMRRGDSVAIRQIGDRARDAQDAVHRPCGKLERFDRAFEQGLIRGRQTTGRHRLRLIETTIQRARTRELAFARSHDARTNRIARLAGWCVGA